ncbi:MGDG synthase family glycosyltransferase [Cohnella rhizosphaerae]|uniref:UDP-N-acetylglucosamine 2-epimerase n=1 Tax=Cohnella rhizosphaerae TaxID=1457232 RepID=A0A9X4KX87_9BACL|nr:glycosyltransferase [Cohnella rhizosphaerae]MDG0812850.1 UDP-N-acetylglucosamine 2-epimerase [Cohnella rhizosphaerae]
MKERAWKIVIVYARFGDGHYQVSKALEQQFASHPDARFEVHLVDLFGEAHPAMDAIVRFAYARSMTWFPKTYGWSYRVTNGMTHDRPLGRWLHALGQGKMTSLLRTIRPDAVIHTFPFLATYAAMASAGISIPTYTVITDYELHTRWVHPRTDGYFVAADELKTQLAGMGIREDRIHVTGIPIRGQFLDQRRSRRDICEEKGLDPDRTYILVMLGALAEPDRLVASLFAQAQSATLLLVAGRDDKLCRRLAKRYERQTRVRVIGFADHIEAYMSVASCIVTKAGAVTLTEALSLGVPVVVYRPIPGQEQGNAEYWQRRSALRMATNASSLRAAVDSALQSAASKPACPNAHADASRVIVDEVLRGCGSRIRYGSATLTERAQAGRSRRRPMRS